MDTGLVCRKTAPRRRQGLNYTKGHLLEERQLKHKEANTKPLTAPDLQASAASSWVGCPCPQARAWPGLTHQPGFGVSTCFRSFLGGNRINQAASPTSRSWEARFLLADRPAQGWLKGTQQTSFRELRSHPNLCGLSGLLPSVLGAQTSSRKQGGVSEAANLPPAALCSSLLPGNQAASLISPERSIDDSEKNRKAWR